jgi:four helix bundle protein
MVSNDLRERTKNFALRIIRLSASLPDTLEARTIGKQILRSGTSVGAQYREACRAKSDSDYLSKIGGALQELDESDYWLELLCESGTVSKQLLEPLMNETNELLAIFTTIAKKLKTKLGK